MFILTLTSDHLSVATALTCGRSRQVSLYYYFRYYKKEPLVHGRVCGHVGRESPPGIGKAHGGITPGCLSSDDFLCLGFAGVL